MCCGSQPPPWKKGDGDSLLFKPGGKSFKEAKQRAFSCLVSPGVFEGAEAGAGPMTKKSKNCKAVGPQQRECVE